MGGGKREGGGDAPLPPTEMGSLLASFAGAVVVDGALSAMGGAASGTVMAGKCSGESRGRCYGVSGFLGWLKKYFKNGEIKN